VNVTLSPGTAAFFANPDTLAELEDTSAKAHRGGRRPRPPLH